jgi:mannan polymerase II complex MNN11 subunit
MWKHEVEIILTVHRLSKGYVNFFASTNEYLQYLNGSPRSWAIVPAMRHAMALYPGSTYFFHLSPHAAIMEPSVSLTALVLDKKPLESLMLKDVPVVPPKSVIKTFRHVSASDVDLVISQDAESLSPGSFVLRRGDWAQYFLDAWFDPLYRSYNFAKAEIHALVSNSSVLRCNRLWL